MTSTQRRPAPEWRTPTLPERPVQLPIIVAADVEPEFTRWVWYPYIPAGKLTLLEGDPGIGKSWITCAIATALSNGTPLPGQNQALPPQKVLLASAEDGIADTIVPRLSNLGARLQNIAIVKGPFTLDREGIKRLAETMRMFSATMVFIDPLVAYLGSKVDMNKANEVRDVMQGLAVAAEASGCAVVAVRHLRKAKGGKAIYQGLGSIDFTAAVRSSLMVTKRDDGVKIMMHIKSNLAPSGPTLSYSLNEKAETIERVDDDGFLRVETVGTNSFQWGLSTDDLPDLLRAVSTRKRTYEREKEFIFEQLRDGSRSALVMEAAAGAAGLSWTAVKRAKEGVAVSRKTPGGWIWELVERSGFGDAEANARELIEASKRGRSGEALGTGVPGQV